MPVVSIRLDADVEAPLRARYARAAGRYARRFQVGTQGSQLAFGRWIKRELRLALEAIDCDPWIGGRTRRVLGSLHEPSPTEVLKVVVSLRANPTWSGWVDMPSCQRHRKLQRKALGASLN